MAILRREDHLSPDQFDRIKTALADRYNIERELGQGGMATIYLAMDLKLHRQVAVKVLRPDLAAALGAERFEREIRLAAQLNHPHILGVHDSGDADGLLYYVMPFADGESLRDRLNREKQLPLDDALQIACEVADALSYAHSRDIVHRDIKPENILLDSGHAIVADFGIARAISAAGGEDLTRTGIAIGTAAYMSPEQAAGSRDLDGRSDLYSLGCLLYEMLAGQPPFMGRSAEIIIRQHLTAEPPPITTLRPSVPSEVAAAIQRSLSKSPADRFSPAAQFGEALRAVPRLTSPAAPARPPWWRRAALATGVVVTLAALFVLGRAFLGRTGAAGTDIAARWMIVAEIDGSADASIRSAVRGLLTTALDQSPAVRTLSDPDIARGKIIAGKPDTARLTEALAIELAQRAQIPAVLVGQVDRVGSTYALSLRVINADSGVAVVAVQAVAQGDDEVIPRVSDAATQLVRGLEADPGAIGPIRPLVEVMTPSMAALQLYRQGRNRQAIALDSTFSQAWALLAIGLMNSGQIDSGRVAIAKALSHPERMTVYQRRRSEALTKFAEHDYPASYRLFEEAWDKAGRGRTGANNLAVSLEQMGQYEAAHEAIRAGQPAPFGRAANVIDVELISLLALGRLEDARVILDELAAANPGWASSRSIDLYIARGDWAAAGSTAARLASDPTVTDGRRLAAITAEASALATRGEVRAAVTRLQRGRDLARDLNDENNGVTDYAQRIHLLNLVSGRPQPALDRDTSTARSVLDAALSAALAGQTPDARRYLGNLRDLPRTDMAPLGSAPEVVEAVLAASGGAWDSVIESLTPMQEWTWPHRLRFGPQYGGLVHHLIARAYEATQQLDSAAIYQEKLASPVEFFRRYEGRNSGLTYSFAHQHLVVLYARMGRIEDAERHWEIFSEAFTHPDPELVHLVDEARQALAEANARSS